MSGRDRARGASHDVWGRRRARTAEKTEATAVGGGEWGRAGVGWEGPVTQVPWDEIPSKTIEKHWKAIQTAREIIKDRSFHGAWPGGRPVSDRCLSWSEGETSPAVIRCSCRFFPL